MSDAMYQELLVQLRAIRESNEAMSAELKLLKLEVRDLKNRAKRTDVKSGEASLISRAIGVVVDRRITNKAEIARVLGCDPSSLSRGKRAAELDRVIEGFKS